MNIEQLKQKEIEEPGVYRAVPFAWSTSKYDKEGSQSVSISFFYSIKNAWVQTAEAWSQEYAPGFYSFGQTWIVKKDGTLNEGAIRSLQECGLWDGNFESLKAEAPPAVPVLITVEIDEYQGRTRYRVAWTNPDSQRPRASGGFKPTDATLIDQLAARFQGQTRALGGGTPEAWPPQAAPPPPAPPAAPAAPPALAAPSLPATPPPPPPIAPPAPPTPGAGPDLGEVPF